MKIKLCKNYPKQKKFAKKLTLNFPSAKIEVRSCIGMCKHCKTKATAVIDGKKMKKKTIKKFIKALE
jgi:hypothetical protein